MEPALLRPCHQGQLSHTQGEGQEHLSPVGGTGEGWFSREGQASSFAAMTSVKGKANFSRASEGQGQPSVVLSTEVF